MVFMGTSRARKRGLNQSLETPTTRAAVSRKKPHVAAR
jgi:hypothetical protein